MTNQPKKSKLRRLEPSSFRDPSGFLFYLQDVLYRQVNSVYQDNYQLLLSSGLYDKLVADKLLVSHQEVDLKNPKSTSSYKVIKPQPINFISYPYEWSFSQLKAAALTTLKIQQLALTYGMSLKDASAYNIQFHQGEPILIDTLSFESYREGKPWVAYRQYCEHFLAPLALISFVDFRLSRLLRQYIDGIPLDLVSKLLPFRSQLNLGISTHIHLHAKSQSKYAGIHPKTGNNTFTMSKTSMLGLIGHLVSTTHSLNWQYSPKDTEWGDYYTFTNYTDQAFSHKRQIIDRWIKQLKPSQVWDLGANDGQFSRIASDNQISTVAFDIDPIAVEKNYLFSKNNHDTKMLPLVYDLTNPSPAIGWANSERKTLIDRGPVDLVLALALIHHLAISNNLPFPNLASFFTQISRYLIIEFVPKQDSQVQKLLTTREDIFTSYTLDHFLTAFTKHYRLLDRINIKNSSRILLLFGR